MPLETLLIAGADNPLFKSALVGIVRSIAGVVVKYLESGEAFNFSKLFGTIFRVLPQAIGLEAFGVPAEGAFLTDLAVEQYKKKKVVK